MSESEIEYLDTLERQSLTKFVAALRPYAGTDDAGSQIEKVQQKLIGVLGRDVLRPSPTLGGAVHLLNLWHGVLLVSRLATAIRITLRSRRRFVVTMLLARL